MLPRTFMLCSVAAISLGTASCGGRQPGPDESLIDEVCAHALSVAKREEIGDFTLEQCRVELRKRSEKLRGGFRGWANCLLQMDSIEEAKKNCRENDFMNPA